MPPGGAPPSPQPGDPNLRLIKQPCRLLAFPDDQTSWSVELLPGDTVVVLDAHGPWVHVGAGYRVGWVQRSALATMDSARFLPTPKPPPGRRQ